MTTPDSTSREISIEDLSGRMTTPDSTSSEISIEDLSETPGKPEVRKVPDWLQSPLLFGRLGRRRALHSTSRKISIEDLSETPDLHPGVRKVPDWLQSSLFFGRLEGLNPIDPVFSDYPTGRIRGILEFGPLISKPTRSHLQTVLDECNKQTENLSDKERLKTRFQLPGISIGYFDNRGGSLSLDRYDVRLTIPPGAIAEGPAQTVFISVDPSSATADGLESGEVPLSPLIRCGPDGLRFHESVVLSFPHHTAKAQHVTIRMRKDDSPSGKWEDFDGNIALMSEDHVILLVNHFSEFTITGSISPESTKRLEVGAFGEKIKRHKRWYTIRVHVWDDNPVAKQRVLDEEEGSYQLDAFRPLEISGSEGAIKMEIVNIATQWKTQGQQVQSIDKKAMWTYTPHSRTFHFKKRKRSRFPFTRRELSCNVDVYQDTEQAGSAADEASRKATLSLLPSTISEARKIVKPAVGQCPATQAEIPCSTFKEEFEVILSKAVHDERDIVGYIGCYGLTEKQVMTLCEHLDGGKTWIALIECLTTKGNRFIQKVEDLKHPTKELLKAFFEASKRRGRNTEQSISDLKEVFEKLPDGRAVEIITTHVDENSNPDENSII